MSGWNATKRKRKSDSQSSPSTTRSHDTLTGAVTLFVGASITAFLFLANPWLRPFEGYNQVNDALLLWVPLMVILFFLKQGPSEFGVDAGDRKFGLIAVVIAVACMVPILLFASKQPSFQAVYGARLSQPLAIDNYAFAVNLRPPLHIEGFLYYEAMMGFYFFCWEFFFRGFLLFGLAKFKILGYWGAVFIQTLPFTLLHWSLIQSASKPPMEIASAFFGGLILGALAVKTKSFFYGFVIHWFIALGLDLMVILPYLLHSHT
jgi:membrane protease YdiL (CAAX protease family)